MSKLRTPNLHVDRPVSHRATRRQIELTLRTSPSSQTLPLNCAIILARTYPSRRNGKTILSKATNFHADTGTMAIAGFTLIVVWSAPFSKRPVQDQAPRLPSGNGRLLLASRSHPALGMPSDFVVMQLERLRAAV